jgi:hypothetical protein
MSDVTAAPLLLLVMMMLLLLVLVVVQLPPNGLVVYTGMVMTDDGKEKKVNIDFEPFKPINTSLYMCDNKFHTAALSELLESDNKCVAAAALVLAATAGVPTTADAAPQAAVCTAQ